MEREVGSKFEYDGIVFRVRKATDRCNGCAFIGENVAKDPSCKDSEPVRGECVAREQKVVFAQCTAVGAFLYRTFCI